MSGARTLAKTANEVQFGAGLGAGMYEIAVRSRFSRGRAAFAVGMSRWIVYRLILWDGPWARESELGKMSDRNVLRLIDGKSLETASRQGAWAAGAYSPARISSTR